MLYIDYVLFFNISSLFKSFKCYYFFFQAEDGIRDLYVTGVQTCALPISVLVRYLNQQEPVRLAYVPERPGFKWRELPQANYVDNFVFGKLRELRINPSKICSDEVFLRRVSLDLLGVLPTAEEARSFVADKRADKRERLVEKSLRRQEFADFWELKWSDVLRIEERLIDRKGSIAL